MNHYKVTLDPKYYSEKIDLDAGKVELQTDIVGAACVERHDGYVIFYNGGQETISYADRVVLKVEKYDLMP